MGIGFVSESDAAYVVGSDEVGTGSWAGPMVICAVAVPRGWAGPARLGDSKALTDRRRQTVFVELSNDPAVIHEMVWVDVDTINARRDRDCIVEAHRSAIAACIRNLGDRSRIIVVDGEWNVGPIIGEAVHEFPRADSLVPAVSAASIFAKVYRDREMIDLDQRYPGYGLSSSKGYGTPAHITALRRFGPAEVHRRRCVRRIVKVAESS